MIPILHKYGLYYPTVLLRNQNIPKFFRELTKSQWLSLEELERIQFQKLLLLLEYSKKHVKFYRESLQSIDLRDFKSLNDLNNIPILSKEILKNHNNDIKSDNNIKSHAKTTGGSTGNPVTVFQTPQALAASDAAYWRGFEWAGIGMCYRQGRLWGVPKKHKDRMVFYAKDLILNRLRCSAFSFDEEDMKYYYTKLNYFRPQFLYGYVSMLEAFAKYLLKYKLKLRLRLKCIISTSEVLTDPHRRLFERAFHCNVFNEYGCGEIGTIAHECEHGSMHISAENMIVEINNRGNTVNSGQTGDILVTDLNNYAMPLIRYNLKDLGYISKKKCKCGRGLPVLGGVVGRAYDTIYNRNSKAFHGEFFMYIFEDLQKKGQIIKGFQVIQNSYENFEIKIVIENCDKKYIEDYISKCVYESYGNYAILTFKYVDHIDREPSGKIRVVKSLYPFH